VDLEEVVTEEVVQVDLEAVAVAHMEDLVDLEPGEVYLEVADMADMAEAELDWEEVASVAVEVNQVLAVQAVAVLLGEDMEVVDLEVVDLEVVDLEVVDLEVVDLAAVDLAAVDLAAVDLEELVMEVMGQVDWAMLDSELEVEVPRRVQLLARVKAARA
jgi:hypothetical protein